MSTKKQNKSREDVLEHMFDIMCTLREQVKKYRSLEKSIAHNTDTKEQFLGHLIHAYRDEIKLCPAEYNFIMHYYGFGKYETCSMNYLAKSNSIPLKTVNAIIKNGLKKLNNFFYSELKRSEDYDLFTL